jgi:hypothetical protein
LVNLERRLKPYSATFSSREPDSIAKASGSSDRTRLREWWSELAEWPGPMPETGDPRKLADLAAESDRLVVVLSKLYFDACEDDLADARGLLGPERLILITSNPRGDSFSIRARRNLLSALGGTDVAVGVRLAQHLLDELGQDITTSTAQRVAQSLEERHQPVQRPVRRPADDEEVLAFIRHRLAADQNSSPTQLLRHFRTVEGRACEQKRFHALVRTALEGDGLG